MVLSKAKKVLPLTEATYYILVSLVEPLHGYGIMQNVETMSEGKVKLGPGTLYGAINKLLKEELIKPVESEVDDRRKCYVLTDMGRKIVKLEYDRLLSLVNQTKTIINKLEV